jgi:hypothetical protein
MLYATSTHKLAIYMATFWRQKENFLAANQALEVMKRGKLRLKETFRAASAENVSHDGRLRPAAT